MHLPYSANWAGHSKWYQNLSFSTPKRCKKHPRPFFVGLYLLTLLQNSPSLDCHWSLKFHEAIGQSRWYKTSQEVKLSHGYLIENIHNLQDHCSEAQAGISFKQLSWINLLVCVRKVIAIEQGLSLEVRHKNEKPLS